MTNETLNKTAGELTEILDRTGEPIRKATRDTCDKIRNDAGQMITCASDRIRQNPVPSVLGALAVGVAIGCLITSGKNHSSFQERIVEEPLNIASHIGESLTDSLSRLYTNLKFW